MPGNTRPRTKFRRTFVICNIQGHYDQLMQVLEISKFDYKVDRLIVMGNITDFGLDTAKCVQELIKIKKKIILTGVHDDMFHSWLINRKRADNWLQGGSMTLLSYLDFVGKERTLRASCGRAITCDLKPEDIPEDHYELFLRRMHLFIDQDKKLYVSSDYDPTKTKEENLKYPYILCSGTRLWNRLSKDGEKLDYVDDIKEIFLGDFGVYEQKKRETPEEIDRVWNIGTSYRNSGRLTLLNVDTKEFYQSDLIQENINF